MIIFNQTGALSKFIVFYAYCGVYFACEVNGRDRN